MKIQDATPITLTMGSDGTLSGAGSVTVKGRVVTGANNNNITYAPTSGTCAEGILVAQGQAPGAATQGAAAARASLTAPAATAATAGPAKTGTAPAPASASGAAGAAVLSIAAAIGSQSGPATPLSSNAFLLLNDSLENMLKQSGFQSPPGVSPLKTVAACQSADPNCQKVFTAISSHAVVAAKTDINGKAAFAGVPAGTYYLMGMAISNNQPIMWNLRVDLKPGANSVTVDQRNAASLK